MEIITSSLSGLIANSRREMCTGKKKMLMVCKYFHNSVRKICCCSIMILSLLDTDRCPYIFLIKHSIPTQRRVISMEMNPLTNEHICTKNFPCFGSTYTLVLRTSSMHCSRYRVGERSTGVNESQTLLHDAYKFMGS